MKRKFLAAVCAIAASIVALSMTPDARANVYATNIKLNGNITNVVNTSQGSSVTISYILNEAATAGVTINILSNATVVRTITIASGAGTTKGINSVIWDGKNNAAANVGVGTYSVSITAAATGYADWTQTSDDNFTNNFVYRPRAIAVNRNTNSPYYGRILIGNTTPNGDTTVIGRKQGIIKCNADGSYADEGGFGLANYPWVDDGGDSPIQMKIKEDDRAYFNDWVGKGTVVAIDMEATTNQIVSDPTTYSQNPYVLTEAPPGTYNWFNFEIWNAGTTNARLFLCDNGFPSAGIWWWHMTNGAADPNDQAGTQAVATGGDLSLRADGILIDANTNLYCFQNRGNVGTPDTRVVMFTNWDGETTLSSGAAWKVSGVDDTFRNLYAFALDSTINPQKLAFAMSANTGTGVADGGIRILNAVDGTTLVTNLTYTTFYRSINWDNVGNLYAGSQTLSRWRVFSPPGANQATTVALAPINVAAAVTPIQIGSVTVSGGSVTIKFTSDTADTAGLFTLQRSLTVNGSYGDVASTITQLSPGSFQAVIATSGSSSFYKIRK